MSEEDKASTVDDASVESSKSDAAPQISEGNAADSNDNPDAMVVDGVEKDKLMKVVRQMEFYFADSNLPYDKFMWTLHTKDPEHWVPIETVSSFKRMREYTTSLSKDSIPKALRLSDFLEVNEDGTKVRRRTEVQEPKGQLERSVYAKGFGEEDSTLQLKLEEFFDKYGRTNAVRMRRDESKKFKGSVFAEFADYSGVEAFLKADPKPTWEGKELLIMTKDAYCEMKIKEKGLTGKAANHRRETMTRTHGFNAFREMERAAKSGKRGSDKKDKDGDKEDAKKEVYLEFMGQKILIQVDEDGNGAVNEEDVPFVKGATLKFDGCGGDVSWSEIKEPIKENFDNHPPFIKYSRGDDSGLVGFHKPLSEDDIALVKKVIPTINKKDVTWSLPTEEEEKQFQIERAQTAARSILNPKDSSRDSGRGGRGGRGGGRGGRGGRGRGRGGRGGGNRNDHKSQKKENGSKAEELTGDKRKRAVEPDGGPDVGVRGKAAPPTLQTASTTKKAKTDGEPVATAVAS